MTHEDAGNYAGKRHGAKLNKMIAAKIKEKISENTIPCAEAHSIAAELNADPADVGTAIDLLGVRINKCQLGLFGWGKKPNHGKDIHAADSVSVEMKCALEEVAEDGVVTCAALWVIANRLGAERKVVSAACDTLSLKIRVCQLGAF